MPFKRFLIKSSDGPHFRWSGTNINFGKRQDGKHSCKVFFIFGPVVQEMLFKEKNYTRRTTDKDRSQ